MKNKSRRVSKPARRSRAIQPSRITRAVLELFLRDGRWHDAIDVAAHLRDDRAIAAMHLAPYIESRSSAHTRTGKITVYAPTHDLLRDTVVAALRIGRDDALGILVDLAVPEIDK